MSSSGPANLNSKHAWRELASRDLPKRSAAERVADFLEIHGLFDEETAREQASRCIQCPNPSCVSGCPLCNPIPQWMQLTAEGRFLEAAAVLGSVTNLAEVCTRLCPSDRLCEGTCILDSVGEPVAIQAIERFLSDYAFEHGLVDAATAPPNGCKVAVVGSGPAGLAAAQQLAAEGLHVRLISMHTVKPIDREAIVRAAQETGGLLTIEEHQLSGGLGSAVAEVLCDEGVAPKKFRRLALPDQYVSLVGTHEWLLDKFGLTAPHVVAAVQGMVAH